MQPMQNRQNQTMNINDLQNMAMNVVETFCGILCMPIEVILRPRYGTRYFPPPVVFFSALLMILLPAFAATVSGFSHMIPFMGAPAPQGMFGIGSLSKLYFLLVFVHGFRLYRRMIHPEREANSAFEGPPLPFLRLIPGSGSFWFTRIVIEPVLVFLAASILENLFVFQPGLATYLRVAALALAMKSFIGWYRAWEYIRNVLDARFAAPIVTKLVEEQATQEEMDTIHLASFPKNLPPDIRKATISHIARTLSPDGSDLGNFTPARPAGADSTTGGTYEHHA
jgi:hypothetical protein